MISHEPFKGLLGIIPNKNGDVRVRKPSYAADTKATVNGVVIEEVRNGDYLVFRNIHDGTKINLRFYMPEKTTDEIILLPQHEIGGTDNWLGLKTDPIVGYRTQNQRRGNTVIAIGYEPVKSYSSQRRIAN